MSSITRICFVCLGNIVRSPLAAGLFNHYARQNGVSHRYQVDSAGTGSWHLGESPDWRMRRVASRHGVNYDGRARQFQPEDFEKYDLVVAMDTRNKEDLVNLALTRDDIRKIVLLRDYDPYTIPGATVPDPYYGGMDDFEAVFQIISRSCQALLDKLQSEGIQTVEE